MEGYTALTVPVTSS